MSTSAIRISLAAALLVGTAFFAATTASKAQAVDPNELRAAQETEEEFSDSQRAMQADEEDNDPANANRLMVLDSSGRPYMYDGIRDGITCRARRVPVRRTYRRTVRCGFGGQQQGAFIQQQQGGVFPQQQSGFDPGQFRAAEEPEETFSDEQRALQADEEDNDPANAQRMIIVDASGRPIQYEPSRGYSCRTVRIPTRAVYRRTITCGR